MRHNFLTIKLIKKNVSDLTFKTARVYFDLVWARNCRETFGWQKSRRLDNLKQVQHVQIFNTKSNKTFQIFVQLYTNRIASGTKQLFAMHACLTFRRDKPFKRSQIISAICPSLVTSVASSAATYRVNLTPVFLSGKFKRTESWCKNKTIK